MSIYDNPTFYISIFSSICFAASEILPFLPVQGNGILHAIVQCLASLNKPTSVSAQTSIQNGIAIKQNDIESINKKLDAILGKVDSGVI